MPTGVTCLLMFIEWGNVLRRHDYQQQRLGSTTNFASIITFCQWSLAVFYLTSHFTNVYLFHAPKRYIFTNVNQMKQYWTIYCIAVTINCQQLATNSFISVITLVQGMSSCKLQNKHISVQAVNNTNLLRGCNNFLLSLFDNVHFLLVLLSLLQPGNSTVRLVGGRSQFEGRVEVFHAGRWGTVCANQFDNREAQVGGHISFHSSTCIGTWIRC